MAAKTDVLRVVSPYDQSVVCEVPRLTDGEVLDRIERAWRAYACWREVPLVERAAQVARGLEYFRTEGERVVRDVTRQMGKPITQARREVETLLDRAQRALADAATALAPVVVEDTDLFLKRIEHVPHSLR